eukprot:CAMPEP_0197272510 /NCGR_PEP_ID=MMETSP1432-20130617/10039_1 /TAXON_ID=44447 /ORGANISM="Pseudo-nitzschia delicatissima, Strain UNC1205" /LENGTH=264 /DNA_ID=CAMNT_0042738071 /DNA_START=54 /DNA_END=848 /DNA_ORIENTATION=-
MVYSLHQSRTTLALFVAVVALISSISTHAFVVPLPHHASARLVSGKTDPASNIVDFTTEKSKPGLFQRRHHERQQLSLQAVPPTVWWILSHTTLPFSGVPFVVNGTRKGGWYRKIDLPSWTPPDALFGPVWTFLYTCMGLAVSRIAKMSSSPWRQNPLMIMWIAHFVLNMSWAPVFFGLQRFRLGLGISYLLIGSLAAISKLFYAVDPTAAFLLVPYALWLSFATFGLNVSICKRNPTKNGYNEGMFQAQLIKLQEEAAARVGL